MYDSNVAYSKKINKPYTFLQTARELKAAGELKAVRDLKAVEDLKVAKD